MRKNDSDRHRARVVLRHRQVNPRRAQEERAQGREQAPIPQHVFPHHDYRLRRNSRYIWRGNVDRQRGISWGLSPVFRHSCRGMVRDIRNNVRDLDEPGQRLVPGLYMSKSCYSLLTSSLVVNPDLSHVHCLGTGLPRHHHPQHRLPRKRR